MDDYFGASAKADARFVAEPIATELASLRDAATTADYSIIHVEPLFSRSSMLWIFEAAFSLAMTWSRLSLKVGAFTSRMTPMATGK